MKTLLQPNEFPIIASPEMAKVLGITAATILQKLYYFLNENRKYKEKKKLIMHHGCKWFYHTYDDWKKTLGMFSVSTIKRAVAKLKKLGLIQIEKLNEDKSKRINYYTIDFKKLKQLFGISIKAKPSPKPTPVPVNETTHQDKIIGTAQPTQAAATPEQLSELPAEQRKLYNQLRNLKLDIAHDHPMLEIWVNNILMITAYAASASTRLEITKWHWHTPEQIFPSHLLD